VETVNDLDGNVVNFFATLRDQPEQLVEKIRLTPWAKAEATLPIEGDSVERARRFWAQCWMTIARKDSNQTFRISKKGTTTSANIMREIDYLYVVAGRLQGVQIESLDALEFIVKYDDPKAVIYFDPPYLKETRTHADKYAIEVDNGFHVAAAKLLNECKGMVIVSGYHHKLYDELYAGWTRIDKRFLANSQQTKTESVWLSPNIEPQANLWHAS
jgi:DNA adenine methylase